MYKYLVWDFAIDSTIQIISHNKLPIVLIIGLFRGFLNDFKEFQWMLKDVKNFKGFQMILKDG